MKKRLVDEWGPSSDTDALKTVKDIQKLTEDYRGWDVYLPGLDILNGVLQRTLQRDANDESILDPVPNRPHLPGRPSVEEATEPYSLFLTIYITKRLNITKKLKRIC